MSISWDKLLIGAAVGFGALTLFKSTKFAGQSQFFGFSGPNISLTPDVQTPNCTPSTMTGTGLAMYCNPPGVECASGVDCADARVQYCRQYAPGGVCASSTGYGAAADQGLPGQGPVTGGALGDLINSFGYNPYTQQVGTASPYGYGYNPYSYPSGYGYPPSYGYGYPTSSYGYGYNPYSYSYRYPTRRAYAVTGFDKKSGHFLYGYAARRLTIA